MERVLRSTSPAPRGQEIATIEDLEQGLGIDENELDAGLLSQPEAFYRVAKALALEISRRDAAKQALAEAEAKADGDIRNDAAVADEKITEREVDSQKRLYPKVQAAMQELHDRNLKVGQLSALKEALQQRSYVLKDLVQLYLAGYYGDLTNAGTSNAVKTNDAKVNKVRLNQERRRLEGE